ncbi:MAG: hypothetical protein R2712_17235 [Vicinamibacterales bacterium]
MPAPLLVMLHGFAGWADGMKSTFALAESSASWSSHPSRAR